MLSLLLLSACFETKQDPINPLEPAESLDTQFGPTCSQITSELQWEEESPEGLSMATFMENIPDAFTTDVILGEDEESTICLSASLSVDQDSLSYVESEIQEAEGEIGNMMELICFNHLKVDATLSLSTEDGSLAENLQVELLIESIEEESGPIAAIQAEIDALEGSISSLVSDEEIEGMFLNGFINEHEFSGFINATTVVEDDEFVTATYHQLAEWNGAFQESCE